MEVLILKLGATGDVVRTTALLHNLPGRVTWITAAKNLPFIQNLHPNLRPLAWEGRASAAGGVYDLLINLEDTADVAEFARDVRAKQRFGACIDGQGRLSYTDDSRDWFDLSLISRFGRVKADELKLHNRSTYQDLVFRGLGWNFNGEEYLLPPSPQTNLAGDIAIAAESGPVWPMKQWAYYNELRAQLESDGFKVNVLGQRPTLLEHLSDVRQHRLLIGGDTLPMHLALGSGVPCVSIFNCTSPWEIFDYGIQSKLVSPHLEEFFYKRTFDPRATTAVPLQDVYTASVARLKASSPSPIRSFVAA